MLIKLLREAGFDIVEVKRVRVSCGERSGCKAPVPRLSREVLRITAKHGNTVVVVFVSGEAGI